MRQSSPSQAVVIRNARLGLTADRRDVLLRDGVISAVLPAGAGATDGPEVVDGVGGVLLPGLVDHHLHLGAWLRARRSSPLRPEGMSATLAATPADRRGWRVVFGLDHQHDPAEAIRAVDAVTEPCLVAHRTGHAFLINAAAARLLGKGRSTMLDHGRGLWGRALGPADRDWEVDELSSLTRDLLSQGVVAVQDATPYRDSAAARCRWLRRRLAPVRVGFMADPYDPLAFAWWTKLFAVDQATDSLVRSLAVHAVEPAEIVDAVDLLRSREPGEGRAHRIEHAALCPPALVELIAAVGCDVCANPGFLLERAEALAPLRRTGEDVFLHPVAELVEAGVPVRFGSDAPVTRPGVWSAVDAACGRGGERVPFAGSPVPLDVALAAVVCFPLPGRPEEWIGRPADLTLVDEDRLSGRGAASSALATFVAGQLVFRRQDRIS